MSGWNGPRTYPSVAHVLACSAEAWCCVVCHGVMDEIFLLSSGKTGTSRRRDRMLVVAEGRKAWECIESAFDQAAMRDARGFARTRANRLLSRGVRTRG